MRLAEGRRLGGPLHVPLSAEATMRAVAGHPLHSTGVDAQHNGRSSEIAARTKVHLILLVLWKNGSGFDACTSIDPKLRRRIRGWPSGPQKKKRSAKRSTSHPLMPTSAFVSIRGIRSARFSTAPDL